MGVNIKIGITVQLVPAYKAGKTYQSVYLEMPLELIDTDKIAQLIRDIIKEIDNELQTRNS